MKVRPHEGAEQPGPHGALMIGAVALGGTPSIRAYVAGLALSERAQTDVGEQVSLDGPYDLDALRHRKKREGKTDRKDLIRPQARVRSAFGDDVVQAAALGIPEQG